MTVPDEHSRDHLTGFWRADVFFEHLEDRIRDASTKEKAPPFSVIVLDMDRFKEINDTYGHLCGDKALKFFALKIRNACEKDYPEDSFVVRYGGDEMVVVLHDAGSEDAKAFAERLTKDLAENKFTFQDCALKVRTSVGISTFPDDSDNSKALFEKADNALYVSKKLRKNKVVLSSNAGHISLMLKLKKLAAIASVLLLLCAAAFSAYVVVTDTSMPVTVILKSGGSIEGEIVSENGENLIIQPSLMEGQARTLIPKSMIREIHRPKSLLDRVKRSFSL